MESRLAKLEKAFVTGVSTAEAFAQKRRMRLKTSETVIVYLFLKSERFAGELPLEAYGVEIIKQAGSIIKAQVPINRLSTIADNVEDISYMKLPDVLKPVAIQSEGVNLTGANAFHDKDYRG